MNPDLKALATYRLSQAAEDLAACRALIERAMPKAAINRGYYAMFHVANALLASKGSHASKHSGVLAQITRDYVKTGVLSKEAGRHLLDAFELRQKADYQDFWSVDVQQAEQVLRWAEEFLVSAHTILEV